MESSDTITPRLISWLADDLCAGGDGLLDDRIHVRDVREADARPSWIRRTRLAEHHDGVPYLHLRVSDGAVGRDFSLAALDATEHFAQEVDESVDSRDHDVWVHAVVAARNLTGTLVHGQDHGDFAQVTFPPAHSGRPPCSHPAIIRAVTARETSGAEEPVAFCLRSMSQVDAEAIAAWRYPDEYSFYDWTSDADDLAELLDPQARADGYVAVDSAEGTLIGFFQYKCRPDSGVDIGLGLHPKWTGRGLGLSFLEAGLDYARRRFEPERFTLSVASFNRRAITVYERAGFVTIRVFNHRTNGREWEFTEMCRPA